MKITLSRLSIRVSQNIFDFKFHFGFYSIKRQLILTSTFLLHQNVSKSTTFFIVKYGIHNIPEGTPILKKCPKAIFPINMSTFIPQNSKMRFCVLLGKKTLFEGRFAVCPTRSYLYALLVYTSIWGKIFVFYSYFCDLLVFFWFRAHSMRWELFEPVQLNLILSRDAWSITRCVQ